MMKVLKSKWLLAGSCILAVWLGISFIKIKLHNDIVNNEVNSLSAKADGLQKDNDALSKMINMMTKPDFIQKQARIMFNYEAEGEQAVFVYSADDAKTASGSVALPVVTMDQVPNPVKWIYYLMR